MAAKNSYGGAQGRAGGSGSVKHGFPRVPHDVNEPKQLRRYLQSQRDGLNEWRWLFDGLSGLTSVQQSRLVKLLVQLANQNTVIANQQATILQQQSDILQLQGDYATLLSDFNTLSNLHNQDELANTAAHNGFATDIGQLQLDYGVLLGRVNCLDVTGVCP